MTDVKEILERGYVDVKVAVSGIRQAHRLNIVKEKSKQGIIPYLVSPKYIPVAELIRLASLINLPIKCEKNVVFPPGKMASDFIIKDEKIATSSSDSNVIEAEIIE